MFFSCLSVVIKATEHFYVEREQTEVQISQNCSSVFMPKKHLGAVLWGHGLLGNSGGRWMIGLLGLEGLFQPC